MTSQKMHPSVVIVVFLFTWLCYCWCNDVFPDGSQEVVSSNMLATTVDTSPPLEGMDMVEEEGPMPSPVNSTHKTVPRNKGLNRNKEEKDAVLREESQWNKRGGEERGMDQSHEQEMGGDKIGGEETGIKKKDVKKRDVEKPKSAPNNIITWMMEQDDLHRRTESLKTNLTSRYKNIARFSGWDLHKYGEPLYTAQVKHSMELYSIRKFDEINQEITIYVTESMRWQDEVLVWNRRDFGISSIHSIRRQNMWSPDIVLQNTAAEDDQKNKEPDIHILSDGVVEMKQKLVYRSSCPVHLQNFPYDEQTCSLKFKATHEYYYLNLTTSYLYIMAGSKHAEWDLLTGFDSGCRAVHEHWPQIFCILKLRRLSGLYTLVLVLPTIMLSLLTIIVFGAPPQREDRASLGMALFSGFIVVLLILVQAGPKASQSNLGIYQCINMLVIVVWFLTSTIVNRILDSSHKDPVPRPLISIFVRRIGRFLCVSTSSISYSSDAKVNLFDLVPEQHPLSLERPPVTTAGNMTEEMVKGHVKEKNLEMTDLLVKTAPRLRSSQKKTEKDSEVVVEIDEEKQDPQGNPTNLSAENKQSGSGLKGIMGEEENKEKFSFIKKLNARCCCGGREADRRGRDEGSELEKGRYEKEWKLLAGSIDRMFFIVYSISIITAFVFFFPKPI